MLHSSLFNIFYHFHLSKFSFYINIVCLMISSLFTGKNCLLFLIFVKYVLRYFPFQRCLFLGVSLYHNNKWEESYGDNDVLGIFLIVWEQRTGNTCVLSAGVCWTCGLCTASTEHVRTSKSREWADFLLLAVPSHPSHTQSVVLLDDSASKCFECLDRLLQQAASKCSEIALMANITFRI